MSREILDKAYNDIKSQQQEELVIDFDAAVEAQKKKSIKIKFRGEVYEIPPETPQWYMNIVNRKLHEVEALKTEGMTEGQLIERLEINDKQNEEIFRRLFGDEFVNEYLNENFVSVSVLNRELLNPILVKWGWKPAVDTTEKKSMTQDS